MLKTLHATKARQATWLELFFDLIFVAVIDVVAHDLENVHNGHISIEQLLFFPFLFIPVWWIWTTHTLYANRFDNDNHLHRLFALLIMALLVIFSTFAEDAMGEAFIYYVGTYVVIRLLLGALYFRIHVNHQDQVNFAKEMAAAIGIGAVISLSAIFFEGTLKYLIFYLGIGIDMLLQFFLRRKTQGFPVDRKHLIERVSLLALIILGEAVIGMVASLAEIEAWDGSIFIAAVAGFAMIWAIWWAYYDHIEYLERAKRITDANVLIYAHLIFCMGLLVLSSVIEHAIKSDLDMQTFGLLVMVGMIGFFLGKQIIYMASFPPLRTRISINTLVSLAIAFASTFLPEVEYALVGTTAAMLFYIFVTTHWLLPVDVKDYLAEHHH